MPQTESAFLVLHVVLSMSSLDRPNIPKVLYIPKVLISAVLHPLFPPYFALSYYALEPPFVARVHLFIRLFRHFFHRFGLHPTPSSNLRD